MLEIVHANLSNLVFFYPSYLSSLSQLSIELHEFQHQQAQGRAGEEEKDLFSLLTCVYKRMRNLRKRMEKSFSLDKRVNFTIDDFITIENRQVLMVDDLMLTINEIDRICRIYQGIERS